jgi:hypothetical protein
LQSNDYSTPQAHQPGFDANFTAAYVSFIVELTSSRYSNDTVIFAAVGPATNAYYNSTMAAIAATRDMGLNVNYLDLLNAVDCFDCIGCAGHPSAIGQQSMAAAAQPTIAKVMGW